MNKWEKEVHSSLLDSEEAALKELEKQYSEALKSVNEKIKLFQSEIDMLDDAIKGADLAEQAILLSQKRSKIYQKQFQETLQAQISGILDNLHSQEYTTLEKYLKECYEDGYTGTLYDLAKQGLPFTLPINQASVTQAVLLDSKVVKGYYSRLGVDIDKLKKVITSEVSRGIAASLSYAEIARNINNASKSGLYNAQRIARTEGHRIQNEAARDASINARNHGADLVKKWDSTLDGKTRPSHIAVDGEIRELDELFSNGLDMPGDPNGAAEEVINCRCARLHLPRWAINDSFSKVDNFTGEIRTFNDPEDYKQFKEWYWSKENQQYMAYVQKLEGKYGTMDMKTLLGQMTDNEYKSYYDQMTKNPFVNMSALPHRNDWSSTSPRIFTDKDKQDVLDFAKQHGVGIGDISGFDGNPELLKAEIKAIEKYKAEYGIKNEITVSSAILEDTDFAKTYKHHITFNSLALRSRTATEKNLVGSELAGVQLEDIALHEIGHVLCYEKQLNGLVISKIIRYNSTGIYCSTKQVNGYLKNNVSVYSVEQQSVPWIPGLYGEIVPEVIVKNKNSPSDFSRMFVDYLKGS